MNTVVSIVNNNGRLTTLEDLGIEIIRLECVKESIDMIYQYFTAPEIMACSPSDMTTGAFIHAFAENFLAGRNLCYVPIKDRVKPMGMFFGAFIDSQRIECHQGMFNDFRKYAMKIINPCCLKAFEDTEARQLLGYVPVNNRPALFCATHGAGFTIIGRMPNYYRYGDQFEDAWIVIKERDYGTG